MPCSSLGIEKNREYLEGIPFTVITDHVALKWIFKLPNPTGRVGRWVMELRNHDFKIEYRKGALNVVPDALSRHSIPEPEVNQEFTSHVSEEQPCNWLDRKLNDVKSHPDKYSEYTIQDGKLFRNCGYSEIGETPWKLCVPKYLRSQILEENHSSITAGHLGIKKTISRIQKFYYWPGIFRDVKQFVKSCNSCLEHKIPQVMPAGKMHTMKARGPWEVLTVDFIGPFPRSSKGHKHLLVMQDKLTKWVEFTAIGEATAASLKRLIRDRVLCRFGWPKILISDNGSQFVSRLFKTFLRDNNIRHQLTPTYSPQCNSTERVNRVIKTMIKQYIRNDHRRWDDNLPELQFAINTAVQDSTGYSPARLNFGRYLRAPHLVYDNIVDSETLNVDPESLSAYIKEITEQVK